MTVTYGHLSNWWQESAYDHKPSRAAACELYWFDRLKCFYVVDVKLRAKSDCKGFLETVSNPGRRGQNSGSCGIASNTARAEQRASIGRAQVLYRRTGGRLAPTLAKPPAEPRAPGSGDHVDLKPSSRRVTAGYGWSGWDSSACRQQERLQESGLRVDHAETGGCCLVSVATTL